MKLSGRMDWTEANIARLQKLKAQGLANNDIAERFGVALNAIQTQLRKLARKGRAKPTS